MRIYSSPCRKLKSFRKLFLKVYGLPLSTVIGGRFKSNAPLLTVEENCILGYGLFVVAYAPIRIGENTMFSYNNTILTSTHDYKDRDTIVGKSVTIGRNVWITSNVTILPGVTIGDNTIIGAGSVVTRDIPSNVFAAGNPCRIIKELNYDSSNC